MANFESGFVLFDAGDRELTHEEIWDDTLLIQQYDEAMAKVQRKLKQRNSAANTTESEQSEAGGSRKEETEEEERRSQGSKRAGEMVSSSGSHKKKKKRNRKRAEWQVGDFCRAQYTEDAVWYEASIISIPKDQNPPQCWVRFVGYGNTEKVMIDRLRRSQGEMARRKQSKAAEEEISESEIGSSVAGSDRHSDTESERSVKCHRPPRAGTSSMPSMPPPMFPANGPITAPSHLPILPPPPALARDMSGNPKTTEALHTMLMSWYMTGYHTGYYQGLSQGHASK